MMIEKLGQLLAHRAKIKTINEGDGRERFMIELKFIENVVFYGTAISLLAKTLALHTVTKPWLPSQKY